MSFYKYFNRLYVVKNDRKPLDIMNEQGLNLSKKDDFILLHSYEEDSDIKVDRWRIGSYYMEKYSLTTEINLV